ncbi:MAG: hypothetical protein WDW36_001140 [Sanguina aurantia]
MSASPIYNSSCSSLASCLAVVAAAWEATTLKDPTAGPLILHIEVKDWSPVALVGQMTVALIDSALQRSDVPGPLALASPPPLTDFRLMGQLEQQMLKTFGSSIFTPGDFRGDHATARDRINADGFPRLSDLQGRVIIKLDGDNRRAIAAYRSLYPNQQGAALFVEASADNSEALLDPATVFVSLISSWLDDEADPVTQAQAALQQQRQQRQQAAAAAQQQLSDVTELLDPAAPEQQPDVSSRGAREAGQQQQQQQQHVAVHRPRRLSQEGRKKLDPVQQMKHPTGVGPQVTDGATAGGVGGSSVRLNSTGKAAAIASLIRRGFLVRASAEGRSDARYNLTSHR